MLQIQNVISAESYALGHCFQGDVVTVDQKTESNTPRIPKPKPKPFRLPTLGCPSAPATKEGEHMPLFNPTLPDALVMPRPPAQHRVFIKIQLVVIDKGNNVCIHWEETCMKV